MVGTVMERKGKDADCEGSGWEGASEEGVGWEDVCQEGVGWEGAGRKSAGGVGDNRPVHPPDGYKALDFSEAQLNDCPLKCLHDAVMAAPPKVL